MTDKELKTLKENIELDRVAKKLREIPEEERTLKTLKDLNAKIEAGIYDGGHIFFKDHNGTEDTVCERLTTTYYADIRKLKAEAVKWVKHHRTTSKEQKLEYEFGCVDGWIFDFFNLTEEDLKDE